jgi:hypothetical protein
MNPAYFVSEPDPKEDLREVMAESENPAWQEAVSVPCAVLPCHEFDVTPWPVQGTRQ